MHMCTNNTRDCEHTHIQDLFVIELDPHRLRRTPGGQPFADASLDPGYVVAGICVPPLMPHVVFAFFFYYIILLFLYVFL